MPGFLGGSDLAVPVSSSNKDEAADWIKAFTDTTSEKVLQAKGNIPNATNLLGTSVNERAAQRSWFVPTAKHWVDVENGNILRNMLAQILTGKLTIQQAARSASDNIASVLNGSSDVELPAATRSAAETTADVVSCGADALTWRRALRASVPYWLILPVLVVVGAVLGYPIYRLVQLSTQHYGLFELIQHKGKPAGLSNYGSILHDPVFWHTLLRTVVFTAANVTLTIGFGLLVALLLARVERRRAHPAHVRPRARVGDADRRRGAGLVLDDELRQRRRQLHPDAAPPR